MPKFEKGSQAAKEHMQRLRSLRGGKKSTDTPTKPKEPKRQSTSEKKKIQSVVKKAIDDYFISGTATISVPDKVVNIDKQGHKKVVNTLTKTGSVKKIAGKTVLNFESGPDNIFAVTEHGEKLGSRRIETRQTLNTSASKAVDKYMKKMNSGYESESDEEKQLFARLANKYKKR